MNEPIGRFDTARTLNRGFSVAPALAKGIGLTFLFALIGSLARVVVPVLLQQTIDKGLQPGNIRLGFILQMCAFAALSVVIAAFALRQAVTTSSTAPRPVRRSRTGLTYGRTAGRCSC
ncbi:MAG: hypothetical protein ACKO73_13240, partial [Acidimicrobiaceae bacterium]